MYTLTLILATYNLVVTDCRLSTLTLSFHQSFHVYTHAQLKHRRAIVSVILPCRSRDGLCAVLYHVLHPKHDVQQYCAIVVAKPLLVVEFVVPTYQLWEYSSAGTQAARTCPRMVLTSVAAAAIAVKVAKILAIVRSKY